MVRKLYWEDEAAEYQVNVLCSEKLYEHAYAVRLNATPFHPQGGGQPADAGWIGDVEVFDVKESDGDIIHYTRELVLPGIAFVRIDTHRRQRHSRLHSAGHLIGHVLETLAWRPVKAHHWPGEARVVFKPADNAQNIEAAELQALCNSLIERGLPCTTHVDKNQTRRVSFGELPSYGCGGTHVASTTELKGLQVLSAQVKKGQLIVQYDLR